MQDLEGFKVVVNHEERYSVVRAGEEPVDGWRPAGKSGPLKQCLAYIEEVWTDTRPAGWKRDIQQHLWERADNA